MGWLIDEVISDLIVGLARSIYRSLGWIGCLIISLAFITVIALVVWLIVVWIS